MPQEKLKIEMAEKPEYADFIIGDIMLHGNEQRNPKEWYPELLHNSKLNQSSRIYGNKSNMAVYETPEGTIIEQKFPVDPETINLYNQSLNSGRTFKLYTPKKGIRILFHDSLKERIWAHQKKTGLQTYNIEDGFYGQLSTFDIIEGVAIIKVLIK